jgi:phosphatidylinositol glycan class B
LQEWRNQLRSSLHPILFAGIYRAAAIFSNICNFSPVARATLLLAAPKITQGTFAAGLDFFTWKLAESVYGAGSHAAWTTVQYSLHIAIHVAY